jgi:periplasmic protein TonB
MNWPRLAGALLALALHAGIVSAFLRHTGSGAFDANEGTDNLTVVATVSLESGDLFTQAAARASAAAVAARPEPREPPAKDKPKDTDKTVQSPEEAHEAVQSKEAATAPEPAPMAKPLPITQTASVATAQLEAQRAAAALAARRNQLLSAYAITVHAAVERHKLKPRLRQRGQVLVQISIAPSGELLSQSVLQSSGLPELDTAAIASLRQAAPFPPIPPEVGSGPLTLTVPFHYNTR